MAHHDYIASTGPFSISMPAPVKFIVSVFSLYTQRRALAKLSDAALTDIGVTRAEADAEAARPVWDAPENFFRKHR